MLIQKFTTKLWSLTFDLLLLGMRVGVGWGYSERSRSMRRLLLSCLLFWWCRMNRPWTSSTRNNFKHQRHRTAKAWQKMQHFLNKNIQHLEQIFHPFPFVDAIFAARVSLYVIESVTNQDVCLYWIKHNQPVYFDMCVWVGAYKRIVFPENICIKQMNPHMAVKRIW